MRGKLLAAIAAALLSCALRAPAACIEDVTAPDPDDRPLAVRIWSPGASCLSAGSEAMRASWLLPRCIPETTTGTAATSAAVRIWSGVRVTSSFPTQASLDDIRRLYRQDADSGEDRSGLRVGEKAGQLPVTFPTSAVVRENSETARD
jgi:hypothetical protein